MRVLAVAEGGAALPGGADPAGERVAVGRDHAAETGGDGHVVRRGVPERRGRERSPVGQVNPPSLTRASTSVVAARVDDDRHATGGSSPTAAPWRAADVDLLDALVGRGARGDGRRERVEVDAPPARTARRPARRAARGGRV